MPQHFGLASEDGGPGAILREAAAVGATELVRALLIKVRTIRPPPAHAHAHARTRARARTRTHARARTHECARARLHTHAHTCARTRARVRSYKGARLRPRKAPARACTTEHTHRVRTCMHNATLAHTRTLTHAH
eukprot:6205145-Pleurochrysis_carterae.AAC.1